MEHAETLIRATQKNLIYKYVHRIDFFSKRAIPIHPANELNDPFEALPRLLMDRYAREDYEHARNEAARQGLVNLPKDELESILMDPFPAHRMDEKGFPDCGQHTSLN